MPIEVIMPKFGLTMHEGTIQRILKNAGDIVRQGEPIYEVETEKVLYQVEAPASGVLATWLYPEGTTVECGRLVALIAAAGEDVATVSARHNEFPAAAQGSATISAAVHIIRADGSATTLDEKRRAISPVARMLARELGVDLALVSGTGPGGRIIREDIERVAKAAPAPYAPVAAQAAANGAVQLASPTPMQALPVRGMRKTIANRMHQSLRDTAQLTITTEADVSAAVELRERLKREFDFTYTDLLIHAVGRALPKHPRMNSRLEEDTLQTRAEVNVGIAVALAEGLIVPVVRDADRKSLREIAAETDGLTRRAHADQLKLEDVTGGTFTITNLGGLGVDAFTPILNLGETGILGVGRIIEKPAVYRGEIAKRSMLTLSMTFDHRVIDGAPAAAFLQTVIDILNYGDR